MSVDASAPPIVGRERELAALDAALGRLDDEGTLVCAAVVGEPGIGKTRLLRELRDRADARGHPCLHGTSAEFERDLPFGVWEDALDAHLAAAGAAAWEEADDLAGMLPSLRGDRGASLPDERYRVHRAVRAVLGRLASGTPTVLVLDDLHWSDEASIELIASVVQRGVDAPVLLALGVRTGLIPPGLNAALAAPGVTVLQLAPLGAGDAAVLAGNGLSDDRQREIYADSGGNPFYIEQLARTAPSGAAEAGVAYGGPPEVPPVVAAALGRELASLEPSARRFLGGAAVAGDPFDHDVAAKIADLAPDEALRSLDALLGAQVLRTTEVPRRFAFRHPLVRRTVYEAAPAGWRLAAHGRAAATLADHGVAAAARAHHVEQSATHGDPAAIGVLLGAAAETASTAPATAARWQAAALRLMPETDAPARIDTLVGLAGSLRHTGDLAGARARLLEAIDLLPPEETALRIGLTSGVAVTETFVGRHEQATRRLQSALTALPDHRSPEAVAVLLSLASEAFFTTRIDTMCELADEALAIARDLGDPALVAAAAAVAAHGHGMGGRLETAEAARREASDLLGAMSDTELALRLEDLNRLAWAEFYMGRHRESIAHVERGLAVSRSSGRGDFIALMNQVYGLDAMILGDLARAAELHERSLEAARLGANPFMTGASLVTSAQIAVLRGDTDEALRAAREAVALTEAADRGLVSGLCAIVLAIALLESGDQAAADTAVLGAGGWELPLLPALWQARYQEAKARIDADARRLEAAAVAAERARIAAERCPIPLNQAHALRAEATVLLAGGEAEGAARTAFASADCATAGDAAIESATSRLLAGRALADADERKDAIEHLRAAEQVFDGCGAVRLRDEARRALRRLGARAEPRGPSGGDSGIDALTAREREIADLVWDRRTNKQIAGTLFLSEKTVESHLRNVFFKLGVSSRVEVARVIDSARSAVN